MGITVVYDCIHNNIGRAPKGALLAGYTTGSAGIRWTNDDFNDHPGAIRIDQDFGSKPSSDVLDVESGAATPADSPVWAKQALADFDSAARPGQRRPAIYMSASNVTPVVNALIAGGVKGGVGLWVANWNLTESQAIAEVTAAAGPFPVIGVQYSNGPFYDFDVFDGGWLADVSGSINPVHVLEVTRRGWTSFTLGWKPAPGATSYKVKAYWPAENGALVKEVTVTGPSARIGGLKRKHTYELKVRAEPGHSLGTDASTHSTTR